MGRCNLKIDCSNLTPKAITQLLHKLSWFVEPVFVGGDTIYAEGKIHYDNYASVWKILESFNVKVE